MTPDGWRRYFERVIGAPDVEIPLAEAVLLLASDEYPDLDVPYYLARLDAMAEELRERLEPATTAQAKVAALNAYLFDELGFRGNRHEYYDPRNSYLNDVLDRRTGLPITLSVVYLAIGARLMLPLFGVGLPGHFIVKWEDARTRILIDPFNRGEILDEAAVEARVRDTFHAEARFEPEWLASVGNKYILIRMLNNLKAIFLHAQNYKRAWQVVDKLLLLEPRSGENIRDMGLLSLQVGAYRQAAAFLEEYLLSHAGAPDADQVRIYLRTALNAVERLN
jgi:regulator of sirC expression with transglutaminase-like and TPR domain